MGGPTGALRIASAGGEEDGEYCDFARNRALFDAADPLGLF
jgi:hypothetical protein